MTTISFTGDIAFSKYFKNAWQDPTFIDDGIMKFLRDSDHVIANVECPLTAGGQQPYPRKRSRGRCCFEAYRC